MEIKCSMCGCKYFCQLDTIMYMYVPRGAHVALKGPAYYHGIFPSKNLNAGICFFVTKFSLS